MRSPADHAILPSLIFLTLLGSGHCALDLGWGDDSDLTQFVSRPDIRAPLLDLDVRKPDAVDPGYLFLAPWATIYQEIQPKRYLEWFQTGPHIYDCFGNLVWSGAPALRNKNFADFRPVQYANGDFKLTGIEIGLEVMRNTSYGDGITRGQGHVFDDAYHQEHRILAPPTMDSFNMHELRVVDGGNSAVHILWRPEYVDVAELELSRSQAGWVGNMGFREVEIATGETLFEWWSLDHVPLSESSCIPEDLDGPPPSAWDYFHATSVDKGPDGDFLISARHTDCIYKISKDDGSILWRLGGRQSSFTGDVGFARQHDARFVSAGDIQQEPREGIEYISLFDNAADEHSSILSRPSSTQIVQLNASDKTARLIRRIDRPDSGASLIGGNAHLVANGNHFINWDTTGLFSEHSREGEVILQGTFASDRLSNYRAYKSAWKAHPSETELALKCFVHGTTVLKSATICYVSWNGATEVVRWRFFEIVGDGASQVSEVAKEGFETTAQWQGFSSMVHVEGVDASGNVLGTSSPVKVQLPAYWK